MAPSADASFDFYPADFLMATTALTLAERGRLITDIVKAVAAGDREAVTQWGRYIGRVYWRAKPSRRYITPAMRRSVFETHGRACTYCGSTARLEIDHIVAVANGGTDDFENLQPLCKPCNRRKGAR